MKTKEFDLTFQVFDIRKLLEDLALSFKNLFLSDDGKQIFESEKIDVLGKDKPNIKKSRIILVAEDTDSNYSLVSIILRKEYDIVRAMNGIEAVRLHAEVHPDLILMDIQMPELNGLDATRLIRKVDQEVPIIALTAYAFESERLAFMEAGGSGYISKPINPDELRNLVRKIF